MFTGLIEEVGTISRIKRGSGIADIVIEAIKVTDDLKIGDSIAVNGACLTATAVESGSFTAQAVEETLQRTTLGYMKPGAAVNLERALRLGNRLGGHIVQGHVDGMGTVSSVRTTANYTLIGVSHDVSLNRYIVEKGSITVDGISLTVTFTRNGEFGISVIPHTLEETTLSILRVGDRVNLETDIIARYVEKLTGASDSLTMSDLENMGY